jgi:hypothetical protein
MCMVVPGLRGCLGEYLDEDGGRNDVDEMRGGPDGDSADGGADLGLC